MVKTQVALKASRGIWPLFRKLFSISFFTVLLALILIYSIILVFQQGSLEPLVTGVGGRAFLTMHSLNQDLNIVLSNEYSSFSFYNKSMHFLGIIGSFFIILVWLKLFAGLVARSIFSGDISRWLSNWSVGLAFFILLQVIFVLVAGSYNVLPDDYIPKDALKLPWDVISNTFKAMPLLLEPIIEKLEVFNRGDTINYNSSIESTINKINISSLSS